MGIPRLMLWILEHYPQCIHKLQAGQKLADIGITVDVYALDNNAIIHPVCQKMYNYGGGDNKKGLLHRRPRPKESPHEKLVYAAVCRKNEELRAIVEPRETFLFAIDGVAGLSKQTQQRQRRFRSAMERDERQTFDSSCITTGTVFMAGLSKYTHFNIQRQMMENPAWSDLEVVFSNEKVPGEGEHKIIQYLKSHPEKTACIDSPDADLLMLTLNLANPEVYIIRENIYSNMKCKYYVVDVVALRKALIQSFRWGSTAHTCLGENLVWDFVLMSFMLGNDFLPHIPSLEISNEGLDVLMEVYPRVAAAHGHLSYRKSEKKGSKEGELCLNTDALRALFFSLAQEESDRMLRKAQDLSLDYPDPLLQACLHEASAASSPRSHYTLDFPRYRKSYYTQKLQDSDVYDVCQEYFRGMLFVLRYYMDEMPDWHWYYPFHKAPFFLDMYECVGDFDGEESFERHTPLSSFEQLLAVMPPKSAGLLPEALQSLITDSQSVIADFYPREFLIDFDGKKRDWEGQTILPFIDVGRLREAYSLRREALSPEESRRTQVGRTTHYYRRDNEVKCRFV